MNTQTQSLPDERLWPGRPVPNHEVYDLLTNAELEHERCVQSLRLCEIDGELLRREAMAASVALTSEGKRA